jgi:glycosyltransferase involved in cell wall biosynthesis
MKKYKLGTCGNYDIGSPSVNGQVVRTYTVTNELKRVINENNVSTVDYHTWRSEPVNILYKFVKMMRESERILVFPDSNAIKALLPLLAIGKNLFGCKTYYNVIGGWLPEYLHKHRMMRYFMRKLDGVFVQTGEIKDSLHGLGIKDVHIFPNFKRISILSEKDLVDVSRKPLELFFMSRINAKKGVSEMIKVIEEINAEKIRYTLDIYGPIADNYLEEFNELKKKFPASIRYCGIVDPFKTTEVICKYFMQLFPTKYFTEGFPGSILDSFCAGVPPLVARWKSYADVVTEGVTGISFAFNDFDDMKKTLIDIYNNPEMVTSMRSHCLAEAKKYRPDDIIKAMVYHLFSE